MGPHLGNYPKSVGVQVSLEPVCKSFRMGPSGGGSRGTHWLYRGYVRIVEELY